jgi:transglutaminase-like putative cysteine protease
MDARKLVTGLLFAGGAIGIGVATWQVLKAKNVLGRVVDEGYPRPALINEMKIGGGTVRHYRAKDISIGERVRLIQDRIYGSVHDPRVKELATKITRECKSRDNLCEAKAIYDAVRKNVRYIGDTAPIRFPSGEVEPIDVFQSAWRTWSMGAGDCDDSVALIASLLSVIGITARLRVTAPSKFSDWGHIYAIAGLPANNPKKWIALDTTLENPTRFGHEVRFGKNLDFKDLPA